MSFNKYWNVHELVTINTNYINARFNYKKIKTKLSCLYSPSEWNTCFFHVWDRGKVFVSEERFLRNFRTFLIAIYLPVLEQSFKEFHTAWKNHSFLGVVSCDCRRTRKIPPLNRTYWRPVKQWRKFTTSEHYTLCSCQPNSSWLQRTSTMTGNIMMNSSYKRTNKFCSTLMPLGVNVV